MPLFSDHSYLVGLLIMVHEDEVDGEEWRFINPGRWEFVNESHGSQQCD